MDLYQARNAVRIATIEGAQSYAPEAIAKATHALIQVEAYRTSKRAKKSIPTIARQAVQAAEDARLDGRGPPSSGNTWRAGP